MGCRKLGQGSRLARFAVGSMAQAGSRELAADVVDGVDGRAEDEGLSLRVAALFGLVGGGIARERRQRRRELEPTRPFEPACGAREIRKNRRISLGRELARR